MTEAKYLGNISPVLYEDWTDHVPSYYSYLDFYKKRRAAKKQLFRERIVFFAVSIIMACFCLLYLSVRSESMETYDACPAHAVSYGENLWSIANEYKSDKDTTGEYIYKIKKANNLESSEIFAGDVLLMP